MGEVPLDTVFLMGEVPLYTGFLMGEVPLHTGFLMSVVPLYGIRDRFAQQARGCPKLTASVLLSPRGFTQNCDFGYLYQNGPKPGGARYKSASQKPTLQKTLSVK